MASSTRPSVLSADKVIAPAEAIVNALEEKRRMIEIERTDPQSVRCSRSEPAQATCCIKALLRTAQSPRAERTVQPSAANRPGGLNRHGRVGRSRWDLERRAGVHPRRDAREPDENHDQARLDHGRARPARYKTGSRTASWIMLQPGEPYLGLLKLWVAPRPPDPLRVAPTCQDGGEGEAHRRGFPCRAQPRSSQRLSGREWCRVLPGLRRTRHRPP